MAILEQVPVYEDLVSVLAETADPRRILAFRLSPPRQARLDELLDRNRDGALTDEESRELDEYEHIEHLMRLLKARLLQKAHQ